ncbi:MAG: DnaJ domain-containing protein [Weeksellaceae bacterium]|nr:DnaJ domain-containing protein [Acholeplasmataceae bacterium]
MASRKKILFKEPYIGFDKKNSENIPFDILIGYAGNPIIGIKISNKVLQYSADPDSYFNYHAILNQIVTTIGEDRVIQKLDIFTKRKYIPEPSANFLQNQYSEHFSGREFKRIDTYLFFTENLKNEKGKYNPNDKSYNDLVDKVQKVFMILDQNELSPKYCTSKEIDNLYVSLLTMNFKEIPSYDNIKSNDEYLKIGEKYVKVITLIDTEKIEIPSEIEPYSTIGGQSNVSDTAVDNFTFLNDLNDYETLVYNQVINIPNQAQKTRDLGKKQKKHEGAASNSPSNLIMANEIADLLTLIEADGQLIVNTHFSIAFSTNSKDKLDELNSQLENKLFLKGIISSKSAYNQFELFRALFPGNAAAELQDYDLFLTTSEAALCFFFKEKYPESESSNIFLQFTDRQGVPLKIDLSDLPMKQGRINNRNKFVLGPSGSGKSFLMNNIIEQYLLYNYDVVIVDTGDSYSGTCEYKNGKYIKYTDENPITMNPFSIPESEFNIEKTDFLTNLIFLIWKGADADMTTTQRTILDKLISSYYHSYFKGQTNWFQTVETERLLFFLKQFNIYEDDIIDEINENSSNHKTHYDILEIAFDATNKDIKSAYRRKAKELHPDQNQSNYNSDKFNRLQDAYSTLIDETKRKVYDETHLILVKKNEVIKRPETKNEWEIAIRTKAIQKIKEIENELKVTSLSFNTLYEYSEKFLPLFLNNKKHKITDEEFNLRTFHLVLADFYKGGRYDRTLNETADRTLFDEELIVFEIDNIKDNPTLFPIVTLIIMDTFIQKMRLRQNRRKALIIEEAWKAIASKLMGGYIVYLYKTVRKFWGEAIVVTQELNDIIGNAVVKDSIISNSDTFILLDQTKFKDNFTSIAEILSLNKVEQNKIFTINNLQNKYGRSKFKEFYLKRGSYGEVYGNEVSVEQYLTYTTEKPEKVALSYYQQTTKSHEEAIKAFVEDSKSFNSGVAEMIPLINLIKGRLTKEALNFYNERLSANQNVNILKIIESEMLERNLSFNELINQHKYENVY